MAQQLISTIRNDSGNLVSVILQGKVNSPRLRQCIAKLFWHTRAPWELIIISDSTEDAINQYLQGIHDSAAVRVVVNKIVKSVDDPNYLIWLLTNSRGNYLAFLDGETIVTCGWIDHLQALSNSNSSFNVVAPTSDDKGTVHLIEAERLTSTDEFNRLSIERGTVFYGQWKQNISITAKCFMVKRDWLELGVFKLLKSAFPIRSEDLSFDHPIRGSQSSAAVALDVFVSSNNDVINDPEVPERDVNNSIFYRTIASVTLGDKNKAEFASEHTTLPTLFNEFGLLPPHDFILSFNELKNSFLIKGQPEESTWDACWRLLLVDNLEILAQELATIGVKSLFIGGSFVERKSKPADLDAYFDLPDGSPSINNLYQQLNELEGSRIWTLNWSDRRIGPTTGSFPRTSMWHKYRIELQANLGQSTPMFRDRYGVPLSLPEAFRTCKITRRPKGVIKVIW